MSPDPLTMPPDPGFMRLWNKVVPDLQPGGYTVRLEQTLSQGSTTVGEPDDVEVHFDITGPRFTLPGTEIHSVFPPPNSQGSFSSRLPHIALKRRTLPWERTDDAHPDIPWLALVVLADFEGQLCRNLPVREAFTSTAVADALGAPADGTCDHLVVTQSVVDQTFPAREELPLLSHVRQVSLLDAENLGSDLDGWMAVLISNRLPQADTSYGCYLISLEGQLDELPEPGEVQDEVGPTFVYQELAEAYQLERASASFGGDEAPFGDRSAEADALGAVLNSIENRHFEAQARSEPESDWVMTRSPEAETPHAAEYSFRYRESAVVDYLDMSIWDPGTRQLRFPVLAHWTFRTEGAADFQQLMENLDVGMLGKQPSEDENVPILDTGHAVVDRLSRRGETAKAWYRGPLTPRQVKRRESPPPTFTAEQALRLGEDGRWDISEAAAFEIGRLLALSDAAFISQLARWRKEGFVFARKSVTGKFDSVVKDAFDNELFAPYRHLEFEMVKEVAKIPDLRGPIVDLVDHGPLLNLDKDIEVIAAGFNLDTKTVGAALSEGLAFQPATRDEDAGDVVAGFDDLVQQVDQELRGLSTHLDARVDQLRGAVKDLGGRLPDFGEGDINR